jgi:hypothetical protein
MIRVVPIPGIKESPFGDSDIWMQQLKAQAEAIREMVSEDGFSAAEFRETYAGGERLVVLSKAFPADTEAYELAPNKDHWRLSYFWKNGEDMIASCHSVKDTVEDVIAEYNHNPEKQLTAMYVY